MKKHILTLALVTGSSLSFMSAPAEAGGPIFRPGQPKRDMAQPFSTRRGRELEAARRQRLSSGTFWILRSPSQVRTAPVLYRSKIVSGRRFRLF
jgi:hypothetical protein